MDTKSIRLLRLWVLRLLRKKIYHSLIASGLENFSWKNLDVTINHRSQIIFAQQNFKDKAIEIFVKHTRSVKTSMFYTAWKVSVFEVFLVRMQEYADQKKSEHGHFSRTVIVLKALSFPQALEHSFKCPRFFYINDHFTVKFQKLY